MDQLVSQNPHYGGLWGLVQEEILITAKLNSWLVMIGFYQKISDQRSAQRTNKFVY